MDRVRLGLLLLDLTPDEARMARVFKLAKKAYGEKEAIMCAIANGVHQEGKFRLHHASEWLCETKTEALGLDEGCHQTIASLMLYSNEFDADQLDEWYTFFTVLIAVFGRKFATLWMIANEAHPPRDLEMCNLWLPALGPEPVITAEGSDEQVEWLKCMVPYKVVRCEDRISCQWARIHVHFVFAQVQSVGGEMLITMGDDTHIKHPTLVIVLPEYPASVPDLTRLFGLNPIEFPPYDGSHASIKGALDAVSERLAPHWFAFDWFGLHGEKVMSRSYFGYFTDDGEMKIRRDREVSGIMFLLTNNYSCRLEHPNPDVRPVITRHNLSAFGYDWTDGTLAFHSRTLPRMSTLESRGCLSGAGRIWKIPSRMCVRVVMRNGRIACIFRKDTEAGDRVLKEIKASAMAKLCPDGTLTFIEGMYFGSMIENKKWISAAHQNETCKAEGVRTLVYYNVSDVGKEAVKPNNWNGLDYECELEVIEQDGAFFRW